jgi:hypothetical protein
MEHPMITRACRTGYGYDPIEDDRPIEGYCLICDEALRGSDEPDDFVRTEDGLVCERCWLEYYRYCKRNH